MSFSFLGSFLHALFPRHCMRCQKPGIALCNSCLSTIRFANTLPNHSFAVYDYGNIHVRRAIRDFKYHRHSEGVRVLADASIPFIAEFLGDALQSTQEYPFIFIPIPEHPRKIRTKGFNQSVVLASWWSKQIPGSTMQHLLEKIVFTMPQAKLGRSARMKNVIGTMRTKKTLDPKVIYLIVDDVTTTGATFTEARRALHAAGAKKIFSIALAHGYAQK